MTPSATIPAIHFDFDAFRTRILRDRCGFLTADEVAFLAGEPLYRLTQLLIRAGGCRFLCAAQDVAHLERCLEAGGDYVRDVSFPADDRA